MFFYMLHYILLFFQKFFKLLREAKMKKFYCFYCQQDVEPHGIWPFRSCPNCRRRITDKGEGFYKVCDVCGANLPTEASKCVRCGYNFNTENAIENFAVGALLDRNSWLSWLVVALALFLGVILTLGLIYVSFYFAVIFFVLMLVVGLFNMLRGGLHN